MNTAGKIFSALLSISLLGSELERSVKELHLQVTQNCFGGQHRELGLGKDRLNGPKGQNVMRGWMREVGRPKTYCTGLSQCKCKEKMGEEQWKADEKAGWGTGAYTGGVTLGGGH